MSSAPRDSVSAARGVHAADRQVLNGLRRTILQMVFHAKEGHIPSSFSILEILYVLYKDCLHFDPRDPKSENRDRFLLSKGHAGTALYPVLSHFGFFPPEPLMQYCKPGSRFGGHPDALKVPGVEVCSGSLGHGIAMGVGVALAQKLKRSPRKTVVLVGDGEMDEGSFWESVMMARNTGLDNLVVIADCNGSQRYSHPYDYARIVEGFGWSSRTVDGHDVAALTDTLQPLVRGTLDRPAFVVAKTTKGQGAARFIGEHGWHRRTPTDQELAELLKELE